MRRLFIHLLHFTSLVLPHSHLLCPGTCLGRKSISQNSVDRRWDPDHSHTCTPCLTSSCDWNVLARRCFFMLGKRRKSEGAESRLYGGCSGISQPHRLWPHTHTHTHTVQYPLRNCVIHENCGAWATKVLPSSNQCLNFKWIKKHLTMWSYLVAIK